MEQTTSQLTNDRVAFTIKRLPGCIVEFEVEVTAPLVQEARRKAIRSVAKEVSLPGFRKGKVPDQMVIKNFGTEVDKAWQEEIAGLSLRECQKLSLIMPLATDSQISFKMKSHSMDGASLVLGFETEPLLPSVDPKSFSPKEIARPEVSSEKIDETIRQILFFFAEWSEVTGRPVAEGDFVLLDVDVIETTPHIPLFSGTRFEATKKGMAEWMYALVMGKNSGDVLEGVSVPDEDAKTEDKEELKPKKVRVTIRKIETAALPELDDELAKKLGAPSVSVMRERLEDLLSKQADAHVQEKLREQASDFLLKEYPFDLPASLIRKETHFRMKQLIEDKDFQEYWDGLNEEERKNTIATIQQQSEKAVRMFYLCRKILADAKIEISAKDVPPPPQDALDFLLSPQKFHQHYQNPEIQHAEAFSRLILEKAEDYLISHRGPLAS